MFFARARSDMGAIGLPVCLGRMALLLLTAASATLPAILAHKSSWETRPPPREGRLSRGRVGRHQSWGMAASGRQGCSCCHAGSWCAHAAREQHHWEVPSPSSQAAAIAAAASVHQPRAVQQQRCHSGYLAREAKKHPPLCVARGRDGALPGCRWTVLTGLRQVLALDCHQASRWLMALSLCQEALCLPGPSLSS